MRTVQQGREGAERLVLAEQLDAAREGNAERVEELAALRRQVRVCVGRGGCVCLGVCVWGRGECMGGWAVAWCHLGRTAACR